MAPAKIWSWGRIEGQRVTQKEVGSVGFHPAKIKGKGVRIRGAKDGDGMTVETPPQRFLGIKIDSASKTWYAPGAIVELDDGSVAEATRTQEYQAKLDKAKLF